MYIMYKVHYRKYNNIIIIRIVSKKIFGKVTLKFTRLKRHTMLQCNNTCNKSI